VITVSFTFVATVAAIGYTGATPVFVDIDPHTYAMDVTQIEKAITKRTKALLPVHLYGQPADMTSIVEIASRNGLTVIEDAAQAHGARCDGRRVGSIGDLGCFSFYPGKNLGSYGEGGMVVTNDAEHAGRIRMLRDWGQKQKNEHILKCYNYRMDGIQGAILGVKLRHLEAWTDARRSNAGRYDSLLANSPVTTPSVSPNGDHVYNIYAVQVPQRNRVHRMLNERGIQSLIHYPVPVHLQRAYADLGYGPGDLPCSEEAADRVLSLTLYAELSSAQIETVAESLQNIIREISN
jgi:dTDP-4-amino-4,6-dideoxygalactose transaminase